MVGTTQTQRIHIRAANGTLVSAEVYSSINLATDPELESRLFCDELNRIALDSSGELYRCSIPLVVHDPRAKVLALLVPHDRKHEELDARKRLLACIAEEPQDVPQYMVNFEVVYTLDDLRRSLAMRNDRYEGVASVQSVSHPLSGLDRTSNEALDVWEARLVEKQHDLDAREVALEQMRTELLQFEKQLEIEKQAIRGLACHLAWEPRNEATSGSASSDAMPATSRPLIDIDRWRAGDDRVGWFEQQGYVLLTVKPCEFLDDYRTNSVRVIPQLHVVAEFPLITLMTHTFTGHHDGVESGPIWWLFDLRNERDRALLQRLSQSFRVTLEIYDDESRLVETKGLSEPLALNLKRCIDKADASLRSSHVANANFDDIRHGFEALSVAERRGTQEHGFVYGMFSTLPSAAATWMALEQIQYWLEPEHEAYLLEVKGFPLDEWICLRERVMSRALDYGLYLGPSLIRIAVKRKRFKSRRDYLTKSITQFADVATGVHYCDLDPLQLWRNWQRLLTECRKFKITVGAEICRAAATCLEKVRDAVTSLTTEASLFNELLEEVKELNDADILDQVEELEDEDIVDKEEELEEEDIVDAKEDAAGTMEEPGRALDEEIDEEADHVVQLSDDAQVMEVVEETLVPRETPSSSLV